MKARIIAGFLFGIFVGFTGLWGFEIQTFSSAVLFVLVFALAFAALFAAVGKKAIEGITFFFTHYWP